MFGMVIGDIAGSCYEFENNRDPNVNLFSVEASFTDDTVLGIAVGVAIKKWKEEMREKGIPVGDCSYKDWERLESLFRKTIQSYAEDYPTMTYGESFRKWMLSEEKEPYNSCGNGSAMRAAACGEFAESAHEAALFGYFSSVVTHNHPEGIKGAVCLAQMVYYAKHQATKDFLYKVAKSYYEFGSSMEELRKRYQYTELCQLTMPAVLTCLFEADSFEEVIRNCVSIGGDADTLAAIAGSVAEYLYGIPWCYYKYVGHYLDNHLMVKLSELQSYSSQIGG